MPGGLRGEGRQLLAGVQAWASYFGSKGCGPRSSCDGEGYLKRPSGREPWFWVPARLLPRYTMADAFVGTWKLVDSKNFDDFMKSLGE